MRIIHACLAALAFTLVSSSANAATPDWLPAQQPKPLSSITVGFASLGSGVNSYVSTYLDTFNAYARELGIKTIVLDARMDPARQFDQVQDLIAQRVDVMIVWPVNAKAVVPALRRAHAVGIPVVLTNSQADQSADPYFKTFSGPNDYAQAQAAGQMMVKALGAKGNVVLIGGQPGYTVSQQREKGFLEVISKYPGINVLDKQPGNWSREKAQSVMENYLVRFGSKIDGVYSADSNMGVGALSAVKAAVAEGRMPAHQVKFTDCTLTAAGYDAIKAGDYFASAFQSPVVDARAAIKSAVLVAMRQPVPKMAFFKTPIVTRENIHEFSRPTF